MKLGFTTLALFMEPNNDIIDLAKKHEFEIIEILGEDPFYKMTMESLKIADWT